MTPNPEYLRVLSQVVSGIRAPLRHEKLPDLTPEEVTHWLHSMTVEDVQAVWKD